MGSSYPSLTCCLSQFSLGNLRHLYYLFDKAAFLFRLTEKTYALSLCGLIKEFALDQMRSTGRICNGSQSSGTEQSLITWSKPYQDLEDEPPRRIGI